VIQEQERVRIAINRNEGTPYRHGLKTPKTTNAKKKKKKTTTMTTTTTQKSS